jgi:hypothetical protein
VIIILRYVCLSFKRHARIMTHGSPRPRERERERKRERESARERASERILDDGGVQGIARNRGE